MRGPHNIWRLVRTGATFERTGAMAEVLEAMNAPSRLRLAARVLGWPFKMLGLKGDESLPPLVRALTALGPAYIKFGQTLATRPDVVGQELADQLRYLQDKLAPFPRAEAVAQIEAELGIRLAEAFSELSEPVAAASIAQVHQARLAETGAKVAVKVLRPGVERAFRRDVDAFHLAAQIIELLLPKSRRLRPLDVIAHFEELVEGELDLRIEAASAAEFAANTEGDEGFSLPRPVWHLSQRRVMTLGWAEGVPMGDNAALDALGIDRRELGTRVLTLFLRHALRDGFFSRRHAPRQYEGHGGWRDHRLRFRHHGPDRCLYPPRLCRNPVRLYPQGLPPRGRGAFRSRICPPPTAISTISRARCARSASQFSGWMRAIFRWRNFWPICSR